MNSVRKKWLVFVTFTDTNFDIQTYNFFCFALFGINAKIKAVKNCKADNYVYEVKTVQSFRFSHIKHKM